MLAPVHSDFSSLQMFKGPHQDIEAVLTAPVSAVCGVTLDANGKKEYLISGTSSETSQGKGNAHFGG